MKKMIFTSLIVLALSPLTTLAYSFDPLQTSIDWKGVCGQPPESSDKSFCKCFLDAAVARCYEVEKIPNTCLRTHEALTHVPGNDFSTLCKKQKKRDALPAGVDVPECIADLQYYNAYCK